MSGVTIWQQNIIYKDSPVWICPLDHILLTSVLYHPLKALLFKFLQLHPQSNCLKLIFCVLYEIRELSFFKKYVHPINLV